MASFLVLAGTTQTARISMSGTDDLTVQATGSLSVSANAQAVRFNGPTTGGLITNDGTIEDTAAGGRAIRFETSVGATLTATIHNNATGIVQSLDDALQIQAGAVTGGQVTLTNAGTIQSTGGSQGIDFAGATGTFIADITNSGTIRGNAEDGIRIGSAGANVITNSGTINGGSDAAYAGNVDGIQFEDNATGTVTNSTAGGAISADRHGINAGLGSVISVTNNINATITGRNGSGVGSDGNATVINFGTITGAYSNSAGSDINGPGAGGVPDGINDGDGDGIDVDFQATITNSGTIQGTGAGGHGSDGLPNTSEAIAAGGGTITNNSGGIITGLGLGILIDDSSQGNAPFLTTVINDGTIAGTNSFGIKIVSTFADTVTNNGTISGGGGTAILFGAGNNTLKIGAASVIAGTSDGGTGTNTLDYTNFGAGGATVNFFAGTATGTGGVTNFQNAVGSAGVDTMFGSNGANDLSGGGGNDRLYGFGGSDTTTGGTGDDWHFVDDAGDIVVDAAGEGTLDRVFASTSYTLTAGAEIERFSTNDHAGTAAINLTGNDLANVIYGNAGANILSGAGGDDTLVGLGGSDTLRGDAGNDTLIGGANDDTLEGGVNDDLLYGQTGTNQLTGGTGNDWYFIDSATDVVNEASGEGTLDRVFASVTYTLAAAVSIENFSTNDHGGTAAISLTGNELDNLIFGNAGSNTINGKAGNDTLVGLGGSDSFRFDTALNAATNVDHIVDFNVADDTIVLDHAFVFVGPGPGPLLAAEFGLGASPTSASQRILYDPATGALRYDADGAPGGEILFATLSPGLGVTEADFFMT